MNFATKNFGINSSRKKDRIRKFCSQSCAVKSNRLKSNGMNTPKPRTCKRCNETFYKTDNHGSKIHCQKCIIPLEDIARINTERTKSMTIMEYMDKEGKKKRDSIWTRIYIRTLNRKWNTGLQDLPCQVCGYSLHVELSHIKQITDFPPEATLGEINHPSNILVLCPNCHWELDHNCLQGTIKPRKDYFNVL